MLLPEWRTGSQWNSYELGGGRNTPRLSLRLNRQRREAAWLIVTSRRTHQGLQGLPANHAKSILDGWVKETAASLRRRRWQFLHPSRQRMLRLVTAWGITTVFAPPHPPESSGCDMVPSEACPGQYGAGTQAVTGRLGTFKRTPFRWVAELHRGPGLLCFSRPHWHVLDSILAERQPKTDVLSTSMWPDRDQHCNKRVD